MSCRLDMDMDYADRRADAQLRDDVRRLLWQCLDALPYARRWQLSAIALSLRMITKILTEVRR